MKIWHFILHLRLHYQLFILSGGYLLGGLMVSDPDWQQFWLQYLNVHLLLFGGATAFNSYWDRDEGPIGGLKHPPKMEPWMRDTSLVMQFVGLVWALTTGLLYSVIYAVSLGLFWLYSSPLARWKGRPALSLVAIGVSTGTNSLFLGALAAGGVWSPGLVSAGTGTALVMLSLYPVSQIYQMDEDRNRGDLTFAIRFGINAIRRFFSAAFLSGIVLISAPLYSIVGKPAVWFAVAGVGIWIVLVIWIHRLEGEKREYGQVMKIKFIASLSFVTFILSVLIIRSL